MGHRRRGCWGTSKGKSCLRWIRLLGLFGHARSGLPGKGLALGSTGLLVALGIGHWSGHNGILERELD